MQIQNIFKVLTFKPFKIICWQNIRDLRAKQNIATKITKWFRLGKDFLKIELKYFLKSQSKSSKLILQSLFNKI